MSMTANPPSFGPFRLIRRLRPCDLGERYLAVHEEHQSSHTVYRLGPFHGMAERRRWVEAMGRLNELNAPHIQRFDRYCLDSAGFGWAVTEYTGNQRGLVHLPDLLAAKGERFGIAESQRCLGQLLEAFIAGQSAGINHGPLTPMQVLVDPRGSQRVQLFAVARRIEGLVDGSAELARDEVRSVAALGYRVLTGLDAEGSWIPPSRLVRRLDRAWDRWFEWALEAHGGPDSAQQALDAMPTRGGQLPEPDGAPKPAVRTVVRRLRGSRRG